MANCTLPTQLLPAPIPKYLAIPRATTPYVQTRLPP